jgi:hypothetical protein
MSAPELLRFVADFFSRVIVGLITWRAWRGATDGERKK